MSFSGNRFQFEVSTRSSALHGGRGMFVSYHGATVGQQVENNSIHKQPMQIFLMDGLNNPLNDSINVLYDVNRYKKSAEENRNVEMSQNEIRAPFTSRIAGGGLIDLSKYGILPLPRQGENTCQFSLLVSFPALTTRPVQYKSLDETVGVLSWCERLIGPIGPSQDGEKSHFQFASNILVGRDKKGKSQYFLYLDQPLEKGQIVELNFLTWFQEQTKTHEIWSTSVLRRKIDDLLCRLSRTGLQRVLGDLRKFALEKIDEKLVVVVSTSEKEESQKVPVDADSLEKLLLSRRRIHWIASKIKHRLEENEIMIATGTPIEAESEFQNLLWTHEVVEKFRQHANWKESFVESVVHEAMDELKWAIKYDRSLNNSAQDLWSSSVKELFSNYTQFLSRLSSAISPSFSTSEAILELLNGFCDNLKRISAQKGEGASNFEEIDKLALTISTEKLDEASDGMIIQYHDALALCDQSPYEVPQPNEVSVLATEVPRVPVNGEEDTDHDSLRADVIFRPLVDVKRRGLETPLHQSWYLENHVLPIVRALSSYYTPTNKDLSLFHDGVRLALQELFKKGALVESKEKRPEYNITDRTLTNLILPPKGPSRVVYEPHSFQLFLGLIWPVIRNLGWRMDVGDTPDDIAFVPPGQTSKKQRIDKQASMLKVEKKRTRLKLAKAANSLGFGAIPKLTKRLFNSVSKEVADTKGTPMVTVKDALCQFLQSIQSRLSPENQESIKRAEYVVNQIESCFNQLFPSLFEGDDKQNAPSFGKDMKPSDVVGCEHLMRLLLLLPSILVHSGVSAQLLTDVNTVLKELSDFLAMNHELLFDKQFHLPHEDVENVGESTLSSRLENLRSQDNASVHPTELRETILPEDRPDLTDFIELVMSQVVPCRATQEDLVRKNRRIPLGYTGLVSNQSGFS